MAFVPNHAARTPCRYRSYAIAKLPEVPSFKFLKQRRPIGRDLNLARGFYTACDPKQALLAAVVVSGLVPVENWRRAIV